MPITGPTTAEAQEIEGVSRLLREHKIIISDGMSAAKALAWFARYANNMNAHEVATASINLKATHTPDLDEATAYVDSAARELLEQILNRAVELARADFDKAAALQKESEIDEQK
jgi:hypothetical protein